MTKMTCCHHVLHIFTCFHTYRFMHFMYFDFFDVVFVIWQQWNVEHDLVQQNQLGIRLLNRWGHELARWQSCPATWRDQLRQKDRKAKGSVIFLQILHQVKEDERWRKMAALQCQSCLGGSKVSSQCPWPLWKLAKRSCNSQLALRRELIYCARPKLMTFWQRLDDAGQGAISFRFVGPFPPWNTGVCCHLSGHRSQVCWWNAPVSFWRWLKSIKLVSSSYSNISYQPTIRDRCITSCGVAQSDARLCWDPMIHGGGAIALCYRLKKGT